MEVQPQVMISLYEYNRLKKIETELTDAFNEKKLILNHSGWFNGHGGCTQHGYSIVNETDVIEGLNENLKQVQNSYNILYKENWTLREIINKRKWYQFVVIKK